MEIDKYIGWICLAIAVVSLTVWSVSLFHLIKIKNTSLYNLGVNNRKKETFWRSSERQFVDELLFKSPYWVEANNGARVWLWIYRGATVFFLINGIVLYIFGS